MNYRVTAKDIIKLYAKKCVEWGYQFDTYDEYRVVFYWIMASVLNTSQVIDLNLCSKYMELRNKFIKELRDRRIIKNIKYQGSKELLYDVMKVMFDIVIEELKKESMK